MCSQTNKVIEWPPSVLETGCKGSAKAGNIKKSSHRIRKTCGSILLDSYVDKRFIMNNGTYWRHAHRDPWSIIGIDVSMKKNEILLVTLYSLKLNKVIKSNQAKSVRMLYLREKRTSIRGSCPLASIVYFWYLLTVWSWNKYIV